MGTKRVLGWGSLFVSLLGVAGCAPPLDMLGVSETVREHEERAVTDDALSEKHPEYDPDLTIVEEFDGCKVTLNKSASVTRLDIEPLEDELDDLTGRIFANRREALRALGNRPVVPSMEVVNGALKPFNDGLYAAVELLAQEPAEGSSLDARGLWAGLLQALVARSERSDEPEPAAASSAAAHVAAAQQLAGIEAQIPSGLTSEVQRLTQEFTADPVKARPIGFYTWLPELGSIFRRDRFLAYDLLYREDAFPMLFAVADELGRDPALRESYTATLRFYAGLTNPSRHYSPISILQHREAEGLGNDRAATERSFRAAHPSLGTDGCSSGMSLSPPAESPETMLEIRLSCSSNPPNNLLDALIDAIKSGDIDLTPREDSGWYDRQLYALETLLLPERAAENERLLLTAAYKEKLVETFKSLLIQTRETHVKSLEMGDASAGMDSYPVDIYPLLPVEPFPTFYLRTARAYAFLQNLLVASLGEAALGSVGRVLEDGTRSEFSLLEELRRKTALLYGLHQVAAASIGMRHQLTDEELSQIDIATAEAQARSWLAGFAEDEDVNRDPRVIVPMSRDEEEKIIRYWAVVGVKLLRMHASYPKGYEPKVVTTDYCEIRDVLPFEPYLLVEQSLDFTRSDKDPPPTRDEFRALCDGHETLDELREALGAE